MGPVLPIYHLMYADFIRNVLFRSKQMASTSNTAIAQDAASYMHQCFTVSVTKQFTTFAEITAYAEQDAEFGSGAGLTALNTPTKEALNSIGDNANNLLPGYFSQRKCRDTTLGGNDVLNPLPQFCEDDDYMHPHYYADQHGATGLGLTYAEMYDETQQIVWMSFGLPMFNKLTYFYTNAIDTNMVDAMTKGSGSALKLFGKLIGESLTVIITLPVLPIMFLDRVFRGVTDAPVTRYYEFVERMPMYFRFVNSILVNLSVNMQMLSYGTDDSNKSGNSQTGSTTNSSSYQTEYASSNNSGKTGLPDIFKDYELDMTRIIARRFIYQQDQIFSNKNTYTDMFIGDSDDSQSVDQPNAVQDSSAEQSTNGDSSSSSAAGEQSTSSDSATEGMSYAQKLYTGFKNALYNGHLFIGFRVEQGLDSTETFSNQVGESEIARTLNQQFDQGHQRNFSTADGNFAGGALGAIGSAVTNAISGLVTGVLKPVSLDGLAAVATGAAKIDVPEVWMNSSYNKDISFTITCRSPYGDPVSILKGQHLVTACFLAGVLPRATGENSWTSPFIAKMYSPGFFASSLCMITGLTIERGGNQNGWNIARLPLKTVLRVQVKDLSPSMYMYMSGDGADLKALVNIMGANSVFNEYMMTMSGMGLVDRLTPLRNMMNKARIFAHAVWTERITPFGVGMTLGDRLLPARMISAFMPANLLPQ